MFNFWFLLMMKSEGKTYYTQQQQQKKKQFRFSSVLYYFYRPSPTRLCNNQNENKKSVMKFKQKIKKKYKKTNRKRDTHTRKIKKVTQLAPVVCRWWSVCNLTVDETGIFSISPCNGDMNLVMHGSLAHSLSLLSISLSLFSQIKYPIPNYFEFSSCTYISLFFFIGKKKTQEHTKSLHKSCLVEPPILNYIILKSWKNKVEKRAFLMSILSVCGI